MILWNNKIKTLKMNNNSDKAGAILNFLLFFIMWYSIFQAIIIALGGYEKMPIVFWTVLGYVVAALITSGFAVYNTKHSKNHNDILRAIEENSAKTESSRLLAEERIAGKIGSTESGTIHNQISVGVENIRNNIRIGFGDVANCGNLTLQHNRILDGVTRLTSNLDDVAKRNAALSSEQKDIAIHVAALSAFSEKMATMEEKSQITKAENVMLLEKNAELADENKHLKERLNNAGIRIRELEEQAQRRSRERDDSFGLG